MNAPESTSALEPADTQKSSYLGALSEAMALLARDWRTLFVGQNVRYGGNRMSATFEAIPDERKIEFPVAEDTQMGFSTGLALAGYVPVTIYPRMDFLILAANQLVNHLDKVEELSTWRPKVIVRVAIGSRRKFPTGAQHSQDHGTALRSMLKHIPVISLENAAMIVPTYKAALEHPSSVILVEYMDLYDD